jgi:hypothetical protein
VSVAVNCAPLWVKVVQLALLQVLVQLEPVRLVDVFTFWPFCVFVSGSR